MSIPLPIPDLVRHCQQHQATQVSNSPYCFHLFEKALVKGEEIAWHAVCTAFHSLVRGWVYIHPRFSLTSEPVDYFINEAFARLWQYGKPHAQAGKFGKLADYLQYLKRCVGTAVDDYLRKAQKDALWQRTDLPLSEQAPLPDETAESSSENYLIEELLECLWAIVADNELEELVAKETWIYDLKPRQIQAKYAERFKNVSDVSQIKRNILRRLQRHPTVQKWVS